MWPSKVMTYVLRLRREYVKAIEDPITRSRVSLVDGSYRFPLPRIESRRCESTRIRFESTPRNPQRSRLCVRSQSRASAKVTRTGTNQVAIALEQNPISVKREVKSPTRKRRGDSGLPILGFTALTTRLLSWVRLYLVSESVFLLLRIDHKSIC